MSYSLSSYSSMIDDRVRTDAYAAAMSRVIGPDSVVVDLGAGSGFFTFEALRLGARHVHAIEPADAVLVAKRIAEQSGLASRVTFHRALSTTVTLPERADVVVADMRGTLPLLGPVVHALADARTRFLRDGGVLIPRRDVLSVAVVSAPQVSSKWRGVYGDRAGDLDVTSARELLVNNVHVGALEDTRPLTTEAPLFAIDYHAPPSTRFTGNAELTVVEGGEGQALHVWFDATLIDGVTYTTGRAPAGERAIVYGVVYFPWPKGVMLDVGDRVHVSVRADLVLGEIVWSWDTTVRAPVGGEKARFRQSTFMGQILAKDTLVKQSPGYVPPTNERARVDVDVLALLGSGRSQQEMANEIRARYPTRFVDDRSALAHVIGVVRRYET
jgi:protein arginine N-methyltransferase 1